MIKETGPGRTPRLEKAPGGTLVSVLTYVDYSTKAAIKRLANKRKISQAELVRQYIEWGLENDQR